MKKIYKHLQIHEQYNIYLHTGGKVYFECSNGTLTSLKGKEFGYQQPNQSGNSYAHTHGKGWHREFVPVVAKQSRQLTDKQCEDIFTLLIKHDITRVTEWPGFLRAFTEIPHGVLFVDLEPSRALKTKGFIRFWNDDCYGNPDYCWRIDKKSVSSKKDIERVRIVNDALVDLI